MKAKELESLDETCRFYDQREPWWFNSKVWGSEDNGSDSYGRLYGPRATADCDYVWMSEQDGRFIEALTNHARELIDAAKHMREAGDGLNLLALLDLYREREQAARAEAGRLRGLLRRAEWMAGCECAAHTSSYDHGGLCPECWDNPHTTDCALAAALREGGNE